MVTTPVPSLDQRSGDQVSRGGLREQVTSRILTAIFQGRFRSGERLVVQRLAEMYGVSPTPVREALVEVAGFGIVELIPNRGAVVLPFGPQQVREISQVRRVLEAEAARCACHGADPAALSSLLQELLRLKDRTRDEQWDRDDRAADNRLHEMISTSCGSERLAAEVKRYLTLFRALRDVSHARDAWTNYSRSNDVPEHVPIVRAILAKDEKAAGAAMDRHIQSAARALEDVLFTHPEPAPAPVAPRAKARTR